MTAINAPIDACEELKSLEESLWRPETRLDHSYMERILAADFLEFGRSGRTYTRDEIMAAPPEAFAAVLPLKDLSVRLVTSEVALVTYVSESIEANVLDVANRSSLWIARPGGWQLRFHQGTPKST